MRSRASDRELDIHLNRCQCLARGQTYMHAYSDWSHLITNACTMYLLADNEASPQARKIFHWG